MNYQKEKLENKIYNHIKKNKKPRNKSKKVKDLYSENHKTVMKEIEGVTNRCKDIQCS